MNGQKFAVATVAGAVAYFIFGFLIYGLALAGYMTDHAMPGLMKDPPDWIHMGIGELVSGALLTMVIGVWARTGGAGAGLRIGATLGVLMAGSFDLMMFATSNAFTSPSVMLVDIVAMTVLTGACGAVVGAVIGRRA